MGRLVVLTAKKINGQVLATPRVVYVQEEGMIVTPADFRTDRGAKVTERIGNQKNVYEVYEKAIHIEAARNPATTDLYVKTHIAAALAGAGTTQGAGTAITKYLSEALTIGAGATEAFTLDAATVGKVRVILANDAANDAAKIFPASGEFINAQAVNTVLSVASPGRVHFVCVSTAGKWITADDRGK